MTRSTPQHNHAECTLTALTVVSQLCTKRGIQLTPIRRQVLELIWSDHQAVKAYDLLERIKPLQNAAKPATIYRALDFLITQGFIHRVESLNAFVGCSNLLDATHKQLLLICNTCHDVEERKANAVMDSLRQEFQQAGFVAHHQTIEIKGVCENCTIKTLK